MRDLHVQLPDPTFEAIARFAASRGLTVEAVVAAQLAADFDEGDVPAEFFSSSVLAEIDIAREEARRDPGLSIEEVREARLAKSQAWRASRSA